MLTDKYFNFNLKKFVHVLWVQFFRGTFCPYLMGRPPDVPLRLRTISRNFGKKRKKEFKNIQLATSLNLTNYLLSFDQIWKKKIVPIRRGQIFFN